MPRPPWRPCATAADVRVPNSPLTLPVSAMPRPAAERLSIPRRERPGRSSSWIVVMRGRLAQPAPSVVTPGLPAGEHGRLSAVARAELHEDAADVVARGFLADDQRARDLRV